MDAYRDAIRLLTLLVAGSGPPPEAAPKGAASTFSGEMRLQALDFWVRYPDYLALELLNQYEANHDAEYLQQAEAILDNNEPDLRNLPMVRYLFGAYEKTDTAIAVLTSRQLIKLEQNWQKGSLRETTYHLYQTAHDLADKIATYPALAWYSQRAQLVVTVAGDRAGSALKNHQYQQRAYATTPSRTAIPSITQAVQARLAQLRTPVPQ